MENNLIWITLTVIYLLLIVNVFIFNATIYLKLKKMFFEYRYKKKEEQLNPIMNNYLKGDVKNKKVLEYDGKDLKTRIVINIVQENYKLEKVKVAKIFDSLGYVDGLIKESNDKLSLALIHQLSEMSSTKVYPILMKGTENDNYEIRYQSFYALSFLPLNFTQIKDYIDALINSNILRDRKIEMINNLSLTPEIYFTLLQNEERSLGKVVLLRVLEDKLNKGTEVMKNKVTNYLTNSEFSLEIRIAAVVALAATKEIKYQDILMNQYTTEKAWEVRAAIAKAMHEFTDEHSEKQIELLKKMMYDENYWVRFNAGEVLARKGFVGIDALIDISINSENKEAADLAFYILDAHESVNKSINEIEVEKNE